MFLFGKKKKKAPINSNLAFDLYHQSKREVEKMIPLRLLVVGKTGSGKSTLVNAFFREEVASTGVGFPVTVGIQKITKANLPLEIFDSQGLELSGTNQGQVVHQVMALIRQQEEENSPVHLVYYCINAAMGRIEPTEAALIQKLSQVLPVIIVLTQAIGDRYTSFINQIKSVCPQAVAVLPVLAKDMVLLGEIKLTAYGLQGLLEESMKHIPEEVRKAFINAQRVDLELKVTEARRWAKKYMKTCFGIGFIPLPVADATLLVPLQITMLAHLTSIMGVSLSLKQMISLVAGMGGTSLSTLVGRLLAGTFAKLIPGPGALTGAVINGTTASAVSLALAYSYIEVLKQITLREEAGKPLIQHELVDLMNRLFSQEFDRINRNLKGQTKETLSDRLLEKMIDF